MKKTPRIVMCIAPPFNDNILPISLGIVKSLLIPAFEVTCLDLRLSFETRTDCHGETPPATEDWIETQTRRILSGQPTIVGFTVYRKNREITLRLCKALKAAGEGLVVLLGGPEFTPDYAFEEESFSFCDYVYVGEAENGLEDLVRSITEGKEVRTQGVWINQRGRFVFTGHRERLEDVDGVPVPNYDDFDVRLYPEMPLQFSRGCNYQCVFCENKKYFKTQKFRRAEGLFREVEHHLEKYGTNQFVFLDDSLISSKGSKDEFLAFCRLIVDRKIDMEFRIYGIRVTSFVGREDAELMIRAGLRRIQIGLESASSAVRLDMGKEPSDRVTDDFVEAFLSRKELKTTFFMIYGYPIETEQEFDKTYRWLQKNEKRIHLVSFTPFNINLPYLERRDNVRVNLDKPQAWTSAESDFDLRFRMFMELFDLLNRSRNMRYNLTDPGFLKTYTNCAMETDDRGRADVLRLLRRLGTGRGMLSEGSGFVSVRRGDRVRNFLSGLRGKRPVPTAYDVQQEKERLLKEYRKRDLVREQG